MFPHQPPIPAAAFYSCLPGYGGVSHRTCLTGIGFLPDLYTCPGPACLAVKTPATRQNAGKQFVLSNGE
jgi:hypothetical protein